MRLRCIFNFHEWVGHKGVWNVPITSPDGQGRGEMAIEACRDCRALRYNFVAVGYGLEKQ